MLILYRTSNTDNVIGKQKFEIRRFDITLKQSVDITSPTIRLRIENDFNITRVNYAYIDEFARYYFVTNVQRLESNLYAFDLSCDVLETYKDEILACAGEVRRSVVAGDYGNVSIETEVRKDIEIHESNVTLSDKKQIILSTMGG